MARAHEVRVKEPCREQGVIRFEIPDLALPADHPARVLWDALGQLDLSAFLEGAQAVEGNAGRPVLSPRMLLTLWTYAISQGEGSARKIERLVREHRAYEWITGGMSVSHQTLSRFRVSHRLALDQLMTDILAALMSQGLLELEVVAQDGMRVRASAGASSFRTEASLLEMQEQAALHLKAVLAQADDPSLSLAQQAAREAGARDFQKRVDTALDTVRELQRGRRPSRPEPRASATDPQARNMKMASGGFRPAYNVQLAVAGSELGGARTIVGLRVTNVGSDMSAIPPMLDDVERRLGQLPSFLLADANHGNHAGITQATRRGVVPLVSVPRHGRKAKEPTTPEARAWKTRMTTPEAQRRFRQRPGLSEWANAQIAGRCGLRQFLVRGLARVHCVSLLAVITTNLLQHAAHLTA